MAPPNDGVVGVVVVVVLGVVVIGVVVDVVVVAAGAIVVAPVAEVDASAVVVSPLKKVLTSSRNKPALSLKVPSVNRAIWRHLQSPNF